MFNVCEDVLVFEDFCKIYVGCIDLLRIIDWGYGDFVYEVRVVRLMKLMEVCELNVFWCEDLVIVLDMVDVFVLCVKEKRYKSWGKRK